MTVSTIYDQGYEAGVEKARKDLLDHQRIARRWAVARIETIESLPTHPSHSDYQAGFRDGYRVTLVSFVKVG